MTIQFHQGAPPCPLHFPNYNWLGWSFSLLEHYLWRNLFRSCRILLHLLAWYYTEGFKLIHGSSSTRNWVKNLLCFLFNRTYVTAEGKNSSTWSAQGPSWVTVCLQHSCKGIPREEWDLGRHVIIFLALSLQLLSLKVTSWTICGFYAISSSKCS